MYSLPIPKLNLSIPTLFPTLSSAPPSPSSPTSWTLFRPSSPSSPTAALAPARITPPTIGKPQAVPGWAEYILDVFVADEGTSASQRMRSPSRFRIDL
ncbi:hypothetical protein P7C70_g2221, partial [Phenoliferia sp. Uapishka_3]